MTSSEIAQQLGERPDARWRARQIATWIYKKAARSFEEMNDLPAGLRKELAERFTLEPLQVARHSHSTDDVDKLLVHSGDNEVFECVLLPYEKG